jgi:hypothetical protein
MKRRSAVLVLLLICGVTASAHPAAASPIKWLAVNLGVHSFGHVSTPDAVVARAGTAAVGFECGKPSACPASEPPPAGGCGCIDVLPQGPTAFDVGPDGSVWLFDGVKHRLLVWRHGHASAPARAVALPADVRDSDLAVGRDGTLYVFGNNVPHRPYLWLFALRPNGAVHWKAATTVGSSQARLVVGPGGALYSAGPSASPTWTPLTTPAGRPLTLAAQRRGSSKLQPLTADLRLLRTQVSAHEMHFALVDRSDRVVRAWRVRSRTAVSPGPLVAAARGGDVVVGLDVITPGRTFRWEHLVLRLHAAGGTSRLALDGRAVWDPDGTTARTTLRVGADGRLYQLRTDPARGVTVARYSL